MLLPDFKLESVCDRVSPLAPALANSLDWVLADPVPEDARQPEVEGIGGPTLVGRTSGIEGNLYASVSQPTVCDADWIETPAFVAGGAGSAISGELLEPRIFVSRHRSRIAASRQE